MKKFNKTNKKQQELQQTASKNEASPEETLKAPRQSLLEKELIKQVPPKANSPNSNQSPVNNANQSSVIVNYENRKYVQQPSPQAGQSQIGQSHGQFSQSSTVLKNADQTGAANQVKQESPDGVQGCDPNLTGEVKVEQESGDKIVYSQPAEEYGPLDDNRVEQNSSSPIMLTTMQPVPIDHPVSMSIDHSEPGIPQGALQTQGQFLDAATVGATGQFKNETEEILMQNHHEGHIYDQQQFDTDPLATIKNEGGSVMSRHISHIRETNLRNSAALGATASPTVAGSPDAQDAVEKGKRLPGQSELLGNTFPGNQLPESLPSEPQKTVIYLQSTTNENGQQTFIYDPSLQTQHIPSEIVGGLLQNSGLVGAGGGLVNLQDGIGGTTVLVLQEMPSGDCANGGSVVGGSETAVGDVGMIASSTTGAGGLSGTSMAAGSMTTLSNSAAGAAKIPTIVGFR
ncbi:hypothetical protein M8J76_002332 [Diaphorina citri]|nr:hypothetical protein M8J76_002332 [Diaphorina citri]